MKNEQNIFEDYTIPIGVKDLPNPYRAEPSIGEVAKEALNTYWEETTPIKYAVQTTLGVIYQVLVTKALKKRFPRFAKGYAIYCAVMDVFSLGYYVKVQLKKGKTNVYPTEQQKREAYEEEFDIFRTVDQLKGYEPTEQEKREGLQGHTRGEKREWMITHGLCPDCGDRRDSITGCPKHG